MRRVVLSVAALAFVPAAAALMWASGPALAAPVPGKAVCTITDTRLTELSGMVATGKGYVVANDGSDLESHRKVFFLDGKCKLVDVVSFPTLPRDPEDMAQAKDGTIWIADIGDNPDSGDRRTTVALWRLPKGADAPTIYRLKYPDGPHDAEALVLAGDGTPIIVTKELGKAGIYTPTAALKKGQTVELRKAGEFTPPKTTTSNPLGPAGRLSVTGGANSPDGTRVVLRTYADAFEFDVAGGNVVEAITKGTARVTPLPDEPFGEAIAYSTDGKSFLTVSETAEAGAGTKPKILRYAPATAAAQANAATTSRGSGASADTRSWFDKLTLTDITYMIGGVGLLGVLLVGVGVFGILRARRRPPDGSDVATTPDRVTPTGRARAAVPVSPSPVPPASSRGPSSRGTSSSGASPRGTSSRGTSSRSTEYGSGGQYRSGSSAWRPVGAGSSGHAAAPPPGRATVRPPASGVYGTPSGDSPARSGSVYGGGEPDQYSRY
jgi:hypothetical protein